jgi:BTB/POZ domain
MEPIIDWQISRHEIKARGKYLLETGKWADCHFLVGSEPQQLLAGHKLILAMASPVFEAMFFGGLPEKNDPIPILDVQPEAFKSLLE